MESGICLDFFPFCAIMIWKTAKRSERMDKFEFHRDKENRIVCEPRETVGDDKHFHNCMEFIYAIDGEADAYIDGIEYHFSSGQICAVSCFSTHYYNTIRNRTYLVCLIPRRYFRESDHIFNGNSFRNPIVTDPESTRSFISYSRFRTLLMTMTFGEIRSDRFRLTVKIPNFATSAPILSEHSSIIAAYMSASGFQCL